MKAFAILLLMGIVGCSSPAPYAITHGPTNSGKQDLILDRNVQGMSRNEIIMAVQECESNGLRAVVMTAKRQVNGFLSDVVFDVTCAPKVKTF
jgi:hypothetical protein